MDGQEGWKRIGEVESDGVLWLVFEGHQGHSDDWRTFKVCADGMATRKANYWLAKNIRTGQIGYSRDMAMMRETREELHRAVEKILSTTCTG